MKDYDFNEEEFELWRNDVFFRRSMEWCMCNDLSKEEALSRILSEVLKLKEEAFQEKLTKMMNSPVPLIFKF